MSIIFYFKSDFVLYPWVLQNKKNLRVREVHNIFVQSSTESNYRWMMQQNLNYFQDSTSISTKLAFGKNLIGTP